MKKISRTAIFFLFLTLTSSSAIWYGDDGNGNRVPFGTYDNSNHWKGSNIVIPVSKSPDADKYLNLKLFFGLMAAFSFLYFFLGEGSFKNRKEDLVIRYSVLGSGIIFASVFIIIWNKSDEIISAWNLAHPKEVAFAKIVNEENRVSVIRDRAKTELNIDLDSLLEKHGIHSSSNPANVINNNFSPTNCQSQTIYR